MLPITGHLYGQVRKQAEMESYKSIHTKFDASQLTDDICVRQLLHHFDILHRPLTYVHAE